MIENSIPHDTKAIKRAIPKNLVWPSIGLMLLILFGIQALLAAFGWRWEWLARWQAVDIYAKWTGFGLAIYLGSQWVLPVMRLLGKNKQAKRFYTLHKNAGTVAPLLFYIHSMQFGYAFMFVLSAVYFSNVALGIFSLDVVARYVKLDRKRYGFWWMILHVALSFLTMGLMINHIFIAFAYK